MYLFKSKLYLLFIVICLSLCPRRVRLQRRKELLDIFNPEVLKRARVPAHLKRAGPPKPIVWEPPVLRFRSNTTNVPRTGLLFIKTQKHFPVTSINSQPDTSKVGTSNPKNNAEHQDNIMYISDQIVEGQQDTDDELNQDNEVVSPEDYSQENADGLKPTEYYLRNPIQEPGFDLTAEEIQLFKIWPQGKVPYYFDRYSFGKVMRDRVRAFLLEASLLTGLQFWELPSPPQDQEYRWVLFMNRRKILYCEDYTYRDFNNSGVQDVVLGYDCINDHGKMAGLVLALAGIPPMHNSPDRNTYIIISRKDIVPEQKPLFERTKDKAWIFHDLAYDFESAGHYHLFKHTKTGKATIRPLVCTYKINKPTEIDVGYPNGFSPTDVLKIRMLYNYINKKRNIESDSKNCKKMFNCDNVQKPLAAPESNPRPKPDQYLYGGYKFFEE